MYACARFGGEGACPEEDNCPISMEGRAFVESAPAFEGQMRLGFSGFAGLDAPACIKILEARGVDPRASALLLPFWEQGMTSAVAKRKADEDS